MSPDISREMNQDPNERVTAAASATMSFNPNGCSTVDPTKIDNLVLFNMMSSLQKSMDAKRNEIVSSK